MRVDALKNRRNGVKINGDTLRKFYVRNGIGVRYCNFQYKHAERVTRNDRFDFAAKLYNLIHLTNETNVVYFDESSLNLWPNVTHTWSHASQKVLIPKTAKRLKGITVYGCIGEQLKKAVFMHGESTNQIDVVEFLKLVRENFKHKDETILMVLDNHSSHKTLSVRAEMVAQRIQPIFMPNYSPEFNR